jgi:hypothetical protein
MIDIKYRKAFSEIYEIMKIIPNDLKIKISPKFLKIIEENRDKNYSIKINSDIEKNTFLYETEIILGIIYRQFWCSQEERKSLFRKDVEDLNN